MIELRKIFILVFVISLLGITASCYTQSSPVKGDCLFAEKINQIKEYVVSIEAYSSDKEAKVCRIGTGLILNKNGLIITRESVILESDSIVIVDTNQRQGSAWIVYKNQGIILLGTNLPIEVKPSFYKDAEVNNNSRLAVLGNSFGIFPSVMLGEYMGDLPNGFKKLNIFLAPGNTGSPVINTQGHIVGLITGRFDLYSDDSKERNRGVFIPLTIVFHTIKKFIKPNRGWIGISAVDREKDDDNIIEVIRVFKGSPAYKAGIKAGDIIVTFQDSTMHSIHDIAKGISQFEPYSTVTFQILRGDQTLTKKVTIGDPILIRDYSK